MRKQPATPKYKLKNCCRCRRKKDDEPASSGIICDLQLQAGRGELLVAVAPVGVTRAARYEFRAEARLFALSRFKQIGARKIRKHSAFAIAERSISRETLVFERRNFALNVKRATAFYFLLKIVIDILL